MKQYLLALETSGGVISAALSDMETRAVVSEFNSNASTPGATRLLAGIDFLLADADLTKDALAAVAVAEGPGSFTSLRVGCMVTKTLAHQLNIPLLAVPSLLSRLHAHLGGFPEPGWPTLVMTDARRGQVYAACYAAASNQVDDHDDDPENRELSEALGTAQPAATESAAVNGELPWRDAISPTNMAALDFLRYAIENIGNRPAVLCCSQELVDGLGEESSQIPTSWEFLPGSPPAEPTARDVAAIAHHLLAADITADALSFEPRYVRPADAKPSKIPQAN
jgi:tRNA threonylcarbamoyl adenosine modification protein YeaZ